MNVLLQSLERDGYVTRPEHAPEGRVLPTRLTELGRSRLNVASAAVRGVEDRMRSDLDAAEREQLRLLLRKCVAALS
jgi:DNA-binding MarR family transcriptional regulator